MPVDIREPKQARSRQTFDRLLDATEALLREKEFAAITIAEIVQRAGASTGAFYARFPAKEALLPALYDRLTQKVRENRQIARDPRTWGERSLAARVTMI